MDSSEEAWREVEGLRENLKELREGVEGLLKERGLGHSNSAASNVTVSAGGIAVWVAASACAVAVAVTIVAVIFGALAVSELGRQINDQGRQVGRAQDHLTAIYMMAPHLKPKDQDVQHDHHYYPAADQAEVGQSQPKQGESVHP